MSRLAVVRAHKGNINHSLGAIYHSTNDDRRESEEEKREGNTKNGRKRREKAGGGGGGRGKADTWATRGDRR